MQLKNGSSVLPGSTRVRPGEIRKFSTLVPVRFITKSGCPLTQLKYRSCTFLDKFRCTKPKNKYKFVIIAKSEFRPSVPSACNKCRKFRRLSCFVKHMAARKSIPHTGSFIITSRTFYYDSFITIGTAFIELSYTFIYFYRT